MGLPRFFTSPNRIRANVVTIAGPPVWHITKVLRLVSGDEVMVFDGERFEYRIRLDEISRKEVRGIIQEKIEPKRESALSLHLIQGLPRAGKLDLIIQKTTELGVTSLHPVSTEHSTGKATDREDEKMERRSQIAISAACQSGRIHIPPIEPLAKFEELITSLGDSSALKIVTDPGEGRPMKELSAQAAPREVWMAVGPEGGFSEGELALAEKAGFQRVSFGPRVLRTETAGIIAVALCQAYWGDLG